MRWAVIAGSVPPPQPWRSCRIDYARLTQREGSEHSSGGRRQVPACPCPDSAPVAPGAQRPRRGVAAPCCSSAWWICSQSTRGDRRPIRDSRRRDNTPPGPRYELSRCRGQLRNASCPREHRSSLDPYASHHKRMITSGVGSALHVVRHLDDIPRGRYVDEIVAAWPAIREVRDR